MNYVDLNLRQLRTFLAVARMGSFTRAAHLLHLSQPALTKQVRQLEETLGVRLLDRNTRAVGLTRVGKELAPVVDQLMREIDSVVINTKELAEKSRGVVRIAALPTIASRILPAALARYKARYPGILVKLSDVMAERLVTMVKAEEVDFGIGNVNASDPAISFSPLFTDGMSLVFQRGSVFERKRAVELKELVGFPLILMAPGSSVRRLVDRAFESIGHLPAPAFEATHMSTAAGLVRAGLGIAILPSTALEMEAVSGLGARPIKHPVLSRELGVVAKSGRSLSPAAESFLKELKSVCKDVTARKGVRLRTRRPDKSLRP